MTEKPAHDKPLIDPKSEAGKQAAEIDYLVKSGQAKGYADARRILKEKEDSEGSGGKPLNDEKKLGLEESRPRRRLRNFRLSLIDQDKLGPVE